MGGAAAAGGKVIDCARAAAVAASNATQATAPNDARRNALLQTVIFVFRIRGLQGL
jgi:hypothetical protein